MAKLLRGGSKTTSIKKKKKKPHLVIKFDENARREFITGFHKRNVQRKQKALEEFEKKLKAEKKRIQTETKDMFKKFLLLQKPVSNLNCNSEVIDMGTHSVTVTELSATELAKSNNWIGINEVVYERREPESTTDGTSIEPELEGMETLKQNNILGRKAILKSRREFKKMIKQHATLNVKNSEIFRKKTKIERIRQIKKKKKEAKKRKKLKKQKMMGN